MKPPRVRVPVAVPFLILVVLSLALEPVAFARESGKAPSASRPTATAPTAATHPLDPLTGTEFAALRKILREQGQFSEKTIFVWAQLQEPPKAEVLAFQPGQPFRREALVVAISPEKKTAFETRIDLRARKILSSRDLKNLQPYLANSEFAKATEIISNSPEVRAALEKRGFKLQKKLSDQFWIDLYAPGEEPALTKDGKTTRALRALFADRQGGHNDYGPYVDGLMALVDLYEGKVISVTDDGGSVAREKVPQDVFDPKVLGAKLPSAKLEMAPSSAVGDLKLEGNHARWGQWDFRYSFNQREGLVLHQIGYRDAGKLRSICYRAAISEMLVPYADPSKGWIWREFFDSGEYGLGYLSSPVTPGKELPANALTLNAVLPTESLGASKDYPSRVFFYERPAGPIIAHVQASDGSRVVAPAKELVVGFLATVGNYDYLYKWVFRQDASFGFETDLHGELLNRTIEGDACAVCAQQAEHGPGTYVADGDQKFGMLVSPQILGVYHQHWINLRLDFDIDGPVNAVKECNVKPLPPDPETNPRGRAFTVEHTIFGKEQEAQRVINPATDRTWMVYNPAVKSPLGHPTGYEIEPTANAASSIPESRFGENTSFSQRHFWVTKYQPDQLYAAGWYPNQSTPETNDNLFEYAKDNENIYKDDVVLWYTLGFTHITKPEDYPIMAVGKLSVNFAPKGFFEKSPALGYAHAEKGGE